MLRRPNKKTLFLLVVFSLLLVLVLAYANHFFNGFHFDDSHTIVDNPHIRSLSNTLSFFTDPQTSTVLPNSSSYRPLTTLSLAIDYYLGHGYNQFYFHLSTFVWYLLQLFFMFILFRTIFNYAHKHDWNNWLALFGTAWYGLHTANAETVNYISARSDLLSTALVVIAFVSYIRSPFMRKYFVYLIPFVLAILTKQAAFMFLPLLFVYLLLFEEGPFWRAVAAVLPALIIALLFLQKTISMLSSLSGATSYSYFSYLISQPGVILYYFKTFFLPIGLCADYGWGPPASALNFRFLASLVFIITMLGGAYYSARVKKYQPIAFGILWFFITLVPTSLAPLTEIANDHRMFFPFVGLTLAVCCLAGLLLYRYEKQLKEKRILAGLVIFLALLILLANAIGTWHRNRIWKDEESLWYDVTVKSPQHGRGLMNYGLSQMGKGSYAKAKKYFLEGLKYAPYYSRLYINLGIVEGAMGNHQAAETNFKKALAYDPNLYSAYFYYARWLAKQGREEEAIPLLIKSSELSPGFLSDRRLLISIYDSRREKALALDQARKILAIDPSDAAACQYLIMYKTPLSDFGQAKPTPETYLNISLTYHQQGKYQECIAAAEQAIKLRPNYAEAYNNIGSAYNSMQQWDKAIAPLEKALAIKPDFQLARNNLVWAKSNL